MTTPGTTLIEELEHACNSASVLAMYASRDGAACRAQIHREEATRLRQRAAWVRELLDLVHAQKFDGGRRELVRTLAGPNIPPTAAPETVTGREAKVGVAECRACGKRFPHPAPGTGGTWTCSDACRGARP